MEWIILILIEVQVNDYVTAFLSPNSLPIHHSHPSQLDNDKSNGHSLLYDCLKEKSNIVMKSHAPNTAIVLNLGLSRVLKTLPKRTQ